MFLFSPDIVLDVSNVVHIYIIPSGWLDSKHQLTRDEYIFNIDNVMLIFFSIFSATCSKCYCSSRLSHYVLWISKHILLLCVFEQVKISLTCWMRSWRHTISAGRTALPLEVTMPTSWLAPTKVFMDACKTSTGRSSLLAAHCIRCIMLPEKLPENYPLLKRFWWTFSTISRKARASWTGSRETRKCVGWTRKGCWSTCAPDGWASAGMVYMPTAENFLFFFLQQVTGVCQCQVQDECISLSLL